MRDLTWNDVAECFALDGSLLDAYVFHASMTDWQHVIDVVRAQAWWFDYTVDGSSLPLPEDVGEIFEHRGDAAITLHVRPMPTVLVNTHFFTDDEIEFDFDPQELQGQGQLDILCSFLRAIGSKLDKPVVVTPENTPDRPLLIYTPSEDRVTAARPPNSEDTPTRATLD